MQKRYVCHPNVLNGYPFEIAQAMNKREWSWHHSLEMLVHLEKQGFVSCDEKGVPTKRNEFPRWIRMYRETSPNISRYFRLPASLLIEAIGESRAKLLMLVDFKGLYLPSPVLFDQYADYFVFKEEHLASITYWLRSIELTLNHPLNPQLFQYQPYPLKIAN